MALVPFQLVGATSWASLSVSLAGRKSRSFRFPGPECALDRQDQTP